MRRYLSIPRAISTGFSVALALLAMNAVARAETTVAILGVESVDVPESLAQQVTDALKQRAGATSGVRSVQGKDLVEMKMIFGCDGETASCLAQAGRSLGADKLVFGSLKKLQNGKTVGVSLKVLDVKTAAIERVVSENVPRRDLGATGIYTAAQRWLAQLLDVQPNPTLNVSSEPAGAAVAIDGQPMGRTPLQARNLSIGIHTVAVSLSGRQTVMKTIDLRGGITQELSVTLEPEKRVELGLVKPVITPPTPVRPLLQPLRHPGRPAKIAAIALAAGAVISAAVAIYTYTEYSRWEAKAHDDLKLLPITTAEQHEFAYKTPTCSPPASLANSSGQYVKDCQVGQQFTDTTTAMWVVAGTLAAAGMVSFVVGDRMDAKEKERHSSAHLIKQSLRFVPLVSQNSGALQASFEF